MYEKLGEALRHHSGDRSFYRVVEDGDTKGFHSGKGIEAKRGHQIRSWPPHSPGLMPHDFCLWDEIEAVPWGRRDGGLERRTVRSQSGHSQVTVRSTVRSQSGLANYKHFVPCVNSLQMYSFFFVNPRISIRVGFYKT